VAGESGPAKVLQLGCLEGDECLLERRPIAHEPATLVAGRRISGYLHNRSPVTLGVGIVSDDLASAAVQMMAQPSARRGVLEHLRSWPRLTEQGMRRLSSCWISPRGTEGPALENPTGQSKPLSTREPAVGGALRLVVCV